MKARTAIIASFVLLGAAAAPLARAQEGLPLHSKRLSERVLIAWTGDRMQSIATVALATAKGVVVIDTSLVRSEDARIRSVIEKEFGRKDFKYLINTHFHHDHTAGNQIYADATIVGHRNVPAGMKAELTGEGLAGRIERLKAMSASWTEALSHVEPASADHLRIREGLYLIPKAIAELQEGFTPTYPSVLFEKCLILDMGDLTLELYSVAGTHSDSDIFVYVPEEGLVAVGDMWPEPMLPYLKKGAGWDLDEILEHWGRIVASGRDIRHVNMAHSDMFLSVEAFRQQYAYFRTLWDGLREMRGRGATLEDAKAAYSIEKDFPFFKGKRLDIRGTSIHANNIEAIWGKIAGN